MFEQATLINAPAGTRAWSAFLGLTTQVAVVSIAVFIPMAWPQVLPTAKILQTLVPPVPPAPRQLGETKRATATAAVRHVPWAAAPYQPIIVPTRVYQIVDEPGGPAVIGSPVGSSVGPYTGPLGNIFDNGARDTLPVAPQRPAVAAVIKPPDPTPTIVRYKEGGNVVLGPPTRRVEPPYPPIAKAAHISGIVELVCVVGVDGRIKEVNIKSGNPLLVRPAVEAAWQWLYAPSKLNGVPIEIVTNLTFTFKLN